MRRVWFLLVVLLVPLVGERTAFANGEFTGCGDVGIDRAEVREKSIQIFCNDGTQISIRF